MRSLVTLVSVALAGCSAVFGIDHQPFGDAGDAGDAGLVGPCAVTEHFVGATFDPANWRFIDPTSTTVTPSLINDQLELVVGQETTDTYNGLDSMKPHDLTASRFGARVVPSTVPKLLTEIKLLVDATTAVTLDFSDGGYDFIISSAGGGFKQFGDYVPATDRYWGISFDGTQVNFETSGDGTQWVTQVAHPIPADLPITAMTAEVLAGSYSPGTSAVGTAIFDDLSLCPR